MLTARQWLLIFLLFELSFSVFGQTGNFEWVRAIPTGSINSQPPLVTSAGIFDMETDAASNTFITGIFSKSIDFGTGVVTATGSKRPIFLAKYAPDGKLLWHREFHGLVSLDPNPLVVEYTLRLAVNEQGNIFLAGEIPGFIDSISFGNGITARKTCMPSGCSELFIARFSPDGIPEWTFPVKTNGAISLSGIETGSDESFFIAAEYINATWLSFDKDTLIGPLGQFSDSLFLAHFNADRTAEWVKFVQGETQATYSMTKGEDGNLYLNGNYSGFLDFGNDISTSSQGPSGLSGFVNFFIAKYNQEGQALYASNLNSPRFFDILSMEADASGRIFFITDADTTIYMNNEVVDEHQGNDFRNALVQLYNDSTIVLQAFVTPNDGSINLNPLLSLTVNPYGRYYAGGFYDSRINELPAPPSSCFDLNLISGIPKKSPDWQGQYGGTKCEGLDFNSYGKVMDLDASGNLYFTGTYSGGLTLDSLYLSSGVGIFIAKFKPGIVSTDPEPVKWRSKIKVYPNPAKDKIYLETEGDIQIVKARLYTLLGSILFESSVQNQSLILPKNLSSGIYLLEIDTLAGTFRQSLTVGF